MNLKKPKKIKESLLPFENLLGILGDVTFVQISPIKSVGFG